MAQSKKAVAGSRSAATLAKKVEEFVAQQKNNTYNYKQVAHAIDATTATQQRNIALQLVEMAFNGEIIEVAPGKYKSRSAAMKQQVFSSAEATARIP